MTLINKDKQFYKFAFYGFFKNLKFFESFILLFFLGKGLNYMDIGFLYSIRELTVFVFEIPSGVIADAVGRRRILIFSFAAYILSFLIFYFSDVFIAFGVAMLIYALADAFRSGVHKAMIYNYLQRKGWEDKMAAYYGNTRSWSQKGSALSALTAGAIVFITGNYNIIFLISVIPYLIDMILVMSYPKWLDGDLKRLDTVTLKQKFKQVEHAFAQTFKNIVFLRVLINATLFTGYYKAVKDYIQPVIKSFALSIPLLMTLSKDKKTALLIGVFYFFIYLLTSFTSKNSGKFLKLFKEYSMPMNITVISGFVVGLLSGMFYLGQWYILTISGFIVIMLIENLRKPIGVAYVAELSENNAMATVLSLSSQMQSVFAAIISPLIGWFADKYGLGMSMILISLLLIIFFPVYKLGAKKVLQ